MCTILEDYGVKVPRRRVRESMSRVDQQGNLERWADFIPRSIYAVRAPNSLWHMDGNLTLKDYGLVLHGAINGYLRTVIYLEVKRNNREATVLDTFLKGIHDVRHRIRAQREGKYGCGNLDATN